MKKLANGSHSKILMALFIATFLIASCTETTDNNNKQNCNVCLDEKPDTTAFSKDLNSINHFIPLDSALVWTKNFQSQYANILSGAYKGDTAVLPITETYNLKIIDSIIANPETIGLRVYLGMKSDNKVHLILAGVNANGSDPIQQALGNNLSDTTQPQIRRFGGTNAVKTSYVGDDGQRRP